MSGIPHSGELRDRVGFNGPTRTKNAYGEQVDSWGEILADIPARVEHIGGDALVVVDDQVQARVLWEVAIRWRPGLSVDMECTYQGRTLRITGIKDPTQRRRWLILSCEERAEPVVDQE